MAKMQDLLDPMGRVNLHRDDSKVTKFEEKKPLVIRDLIDNFFIVDCVPKNKVEEKELLEAQKKLINGDNIDDVTIFYGGKYLTDDMPLLHYSMLINNQDMFKILLKNTHDVNLVSRNKGFTPLHVAAVKGNLEMLKELMNYPEVDINKKTISSLDKNGNIDYSVKYCIALTAFDLAYHYSGSYDITKELLKNGCENKYANYEVYSKRDHELEERQPDIKKFTSAVENLQYYIESPESWSNELKVNPELTEAFRSYDEDIYEVACSRVTAGVNASNLNSSTLFQQKIDSIKKQLKAFAGTNINLEFINKYLCPSLPVNADLPIAEKPTESLDGDITGVRDDDDTALAGIVTDSGVESSEL